MAVASVQIRVSPYRYGFLELNARYLNQEILKEVHT